MSKTVIGIIGCGNISDAYFLGAARSNLIRVKACADLRLEAAQAKAAQHGVLAMPVQQLLADPEISIVVNLTVPMTHAAVSQQILNAGKHAYSEKPLAANFADGAGLMELSRARNLRVGCAPDTFLGASHQACRRLIDAGTIGIPVGGSAVVMSHGMESWHPNPEFFFKPGGGPILDVGPYYITQLVNLLGPVRRAVGSGHDRQCHENRHQRAAQGQHDQRGSAHHGQWGPRIREWREHLPVGILGRVETQSNLTHRDLWNGRVAVGCRPEFLREHPQGVQAQWRLAGRGHCRPSVWNPQSRIAQRHDAS